MRGTVTGVSGVGGDRGNTAVAAVDGVIKAAGKVGASTNDAASAAVTGAMRAAVEIGTNRGLDGEEGAPWDRLAAT